MASNNSAPVSLYMDPRDVEFSIATAPGPSDTSIANDNSITPENNIPNNIIIEKKEQNKKKN